ncbi:MAG TPA: hypothetical protein VES42_07685 [Pilimelia sp.]|nr:hypothetical protein [Pilimelia sp.]
MTPPAITQRATTQRARRFGIRPLSARVAQLDYPGRHRARRSTALILAAVLLAATQVGVQLAAAKPAEAVSGLIRVVSGSLFDSNPVKTANAVCPTGTVVIGGGGAINDLGFRTVRLTAMVPVGGGLNDFYRVTAMEPAGGFSLEWTVTAFALCAHPLPGLEIVSRPTERTSGAFKHAIARCPSGKRVLGTGGDTGLFPQVGLHLVRPDSPLTIGRASGRADPGFTAAWFMRAYAVCANAVPGQQNQARVVNASTATVSCPAGTVVHGAGGGGGIVDLGPFFLVGVVPAADLRSVTATMTGTPNQGGMVAQATCAN